MSARPTAKERQTEEAFGRADVGCSRAPPAPVKKMVGRAVKREGVTHPQAVMGLSERRSARLSERKMIHYRSCRPLGHSCAISPTRKRWISSAVRPVAARGRPSGINGISRPFREEGLAAARRRARRRAVGSRAPILVEFKRNGRWSVDFRP
jgi:putative transposase